MRFSQTSSIENMNDCEFDNEMGRNNETALNNQIQKLQEQVFGLQQVVDVKERALGNVHREKEKILADLKRHKRSNLNLRQQLEDEREHFLKEKEFYCREVSESYKFRPKRGLARNDEYAALPIHDDHKREIEDVKKELSKVKKRLHETLEANYNLSIKYLRIKNTNYSLKARFKRAQTESAKVIF